MNVMDEVLLKLTEDDTRVSTGCHASRQLSKICRIHLKRCEPGVTFVTPGKGPISACAITMGLNPTLKSKAPRQPVGAVEGIESAVA